MNDAFQRLSGIAPERWWERRRWLGLLIGLALLSPLLAGVRATEAQPAADRPLLLRRANVIDGLADEPLLGASILIEKGQIVAVAAGEIPPPAGAEVVDLGGRWVLPGMVDAHTHIADLAAARAALRSGVTSARNMGMNHFIDIGMRELHRRGALDLPELLSAGYHIYPRPREGLFLDFPALIDLMGSGLHGVDAVRRVTRLMAERGVDAIKVNATDRAGTVSTDPRRQLYSEEEMRAIVEEARRARLPVAAHAHGAAGGLAAVRAGVHSIEHGTYLAPSTLAEMKTRGTWLVPTLATMAELLEPRNDVALQIRGKHMVPRIRETTARAIQIGVRLAAGTDTDYGPTSNFRMGNEVMELVAAGLSPMAAIRAGTSGSADCLGIGQRTGRLKVGFEADLIVVERNPLSDLSGLLDPLLVVNNGRRVEPIPPWQ
jgi:imidazolonepropionase-like amidohydrolase